MMPSMSAATSRWPKLALGPLPGGYVATGELLSEDGEAVQLEQPEQDEQENDSNERCVQWAGRASHEENERREHGRRPGRIRLERNERVSMERRLDARRHPAERT